MQVPECVLAALLTAHHMLTTAPPSAAALLQGSGAGSASAPPLASATSTMLLGAGPGSVGSGARAGRHRGGAAGEAAAAPPPDMVDLMRAGYHPVDLLGLSNLMSRFTAVLAKPWNLWHSMYGNPWSECACLSLLLLRGRLSAVAGGVAGTAARRLGLQGWRGPTCCEQTESMPWRAGVSGGGVFAVPFAHAQC